ncbi:MAG: type B DNA-directed DNA polymerase, partial [Ignisphaera sp.]
IQIYAFEGRYKEANLDSIAQALLGIGKVQLDDELGKIDLAMLAHYNFRDAEVTLQLTTFSEELVWKLMLLLMRISKLGLEDVCRSTVSVWIKNLFYWEHRRRGYLIPRQEDIQSLKGKKVTEAIIKGKKYAGAIVIEPPQGLFFNVIVLDFASLYPSIMKQWNLSYETIDPDETLCNKVNDIIDEANNVLHKVCLDKPGLTAEIVGMLRDFRVKIYKKKSKDKNISEILRSWYDTVQRAMKVFINAAYGVFGADTFPLYAPSVAESVTALGRRIITSTIRKAEELGLRVLYGDTDSLFIWNPEQSKLEELKKWVEETFGLELEMDKRYKFVAFALKKNYVGVTPNNEVDIKGMMGKKRNTPDFIKNLFVEILKKMTSIEEPEDAFKIINSVKDDLEKYYLLLKYKLLTLDEVAFHMGLSKPLSEYKKTTPQHVKAALMLQRYNVNISPGDVITFVKVKSKDGVKPIQLAKISEIDTQKYLEAMVSTLEQLFTALNISWEDVTGGGRLVSR